MEDHRLDLLSGKTLKELNAAEARGWVIERMNQIESNIDSKIADFVDPKDKHSFKKIILNSSIISTGGKLKILAGLKLLDKKTMNDIRELSSIRNAFAHSVFVHATEIMIDRKNNTTKGLASYHNMEIMNSDGVLKSKKAHEHLERFYELNERVGKAL
ncbi:MAG: hypothetical protein WDZ80_00940 [Candidatus Paceibacterota bacterium]